MWILQTRSSRGHFRARAEGAAHSALEAVEARIASVLIHETLVRPEQVEHAHRRLMERAAGQTMLPPLRPRGLRLPVQVPFDALWHMVSSLFMNGSAYERMRLPIGMSHHYNLDRYLTYRLVNLPA